MADYRTIKIYVLLFLICVMPVLVYSGDWPKWRGPNGNGISDETNWNPEALKKGANIIWRTNVGCGHSNVSIAGDYLYTMGAKVSIAGGDTIVNDVVLCLDTSNGKCIWEYSYVSKKGTPGQYPGPGATPAVDGPYLYTLGMQGHLFCFNAKNGSIKWQKNIKTNLPSEHQSLTCASPVIDGDLLILNANESGMVLNKITGEVVWTSAPAKCGFASPVLFDLKGRRFAAIIANERNFCCVDIHTGKIEWSTEFYSYNDPVILDLSIVLIGESCLILDKTDQECKIKINNKSDKYSPFQNCVVLGQYIYSFGQGGRKQPFQCNDLSTGKLKWDKKLNGLGSVMAANSKLIILSGEGDLIIAESSPNQFKEISRAKILKMVDDQENKLNDNYGCWIAPVLSNGRIYARNSYGELVCVDMRM